MSRCHTIHARLVYNVIKVQVVTLASHKGGSGKTTLACFLAVAAAESGLEVALADADSQGSAAAWYERRNSDLGPDVVQIPAEKVRSTVQAARGQYDLLLLDTAGRMAAANDALALADLALVPCRPTIADIDPAVRMHSTARRISKAAAFVIAQVPSRGEQRAQEVENALESLGPVATVRIGMRNAYADALAMGVGVTEFEPRGKAADEIRGLWEWTAELLKEM